MMIVGQGDQYSSQPARKIPQDLEEYFAYSTNILGPGCLKCISQFLNEEIPGLSGCHFPKDWTGLAECIGYNAEDIRGFASARNPTGALIEDWSLEPHSTVERLLEHIHDIGRLDLLEDHVFRHTLKKSVENHERQAQAKASKAVRDGQEKTSGLGKRDRPEKKITSDIGSCQGERPSYSELDNLVVGDVTERKRQYFDAFVCYTSEDKDFVRLLMEELEGHRGLKLCINARDLLGGVAKYVVTAELIEKRCKRMLIVLSHNFMKQDSTDRPECDFQVRFAQSLSPVSRQKVLLPILLDPCEQIPIIKHVTHLHYYRASKKEWFWDRVAATLRTDAYNMDFEDYKTFQGLTLKLPPSKTVNRKELFQERSDISESSSAANFKVTTRSSDSSESSSAANIRVAMRSSDSSESSSAANFRVTMRSSDSSESSSAANVRVAMRSSDSSESSSAANVRVAMRSSDSSETLHNDIGSQNCGRSNVASASLVPSMRTQPGSHSGWASSHILNTSKDRVSESSQPVHNTPQTASGSTSATKRKEGKLAFLFSSLTKGFKEKNSKKNPPKKGSYTTTN